MRAWTTVATVGGRGGGQGRSASGLQAGGERGLPGACLGIARLKSWSLSSLPTHHLSLPCFLNFLDPQIHPCQNLSSILASSSTFYIFSRSCILPPTASKPLTHPSAKCRALEPPCPLLHLHRLQDQSSKKEMGCPSCLILHIGPFPNTRHK